MEFGEVDIRTWPHRISESRIRVYTSYKGEPISKQRPRFVMHASGKVYTPKHTSEAEKALAWAIKATNRELFEDADSTFGVRLIFFCKNWQRRDIDNMTKLVFDACNGFIWKDDSQVIEMVARVIRNEPNPRTEILIYKLGTLSYPTAICLMCRKSFRLYPSTMGRKFCSTACSGYSHRIRINKECSHCGKPLYIAPYQEKVGSKRNYYCNIQCFHLAKTVEKTCGECGKTFRRPKSMERAGNSYCSEACFEAYWRKRRPKLAEGICQKCGGPTSKKKYVCCQACRISNKTFRSPGQPKGWKSAIA